MVISFAYPLDVYCDFFIVCMTDYYRITIPNDVCTIIALFLFLRILTTNYSDTHHREITVNTREDATEITIPWFTTNLIFLQCTNMQCFGACSHVILYILFEITIFYTTWML